MTGQIEGFDWDLANVGHVLRHAMRPSEVEEAVGRPHLVVSAKAIEGEERWKLFGTTAANRYVVVVFTIRRKLFRAVTAYPMNAAERRKYAAQIE
ncbi:MAG: BrnT family toxin [Terriglobia bacterium]